MKERKYLLSHIGNTGGTSAMFYMKGNKAFDVKGTKIVHIKTTWHKKFHFTIVLSCLADGTKLKAMVIFRRKTILKWSFPNSVFIYVHEKGWMNENVVKL